MNDEQFLASIAFAPDDPLRKMAYADWLEEEGEGDRAEFLRRWLAGEYGDEWSELCDRVGRLWRARATGQRFARGLIGHYAVEPGGWWDMTADLGQIALTSLLGTYAGVNGKTDDVHNYDGVLARNSVCWQDSLAALFAPEDTPQVEIEHLEDWRGEVVRVLERWLHPADDADGRRWHAERVLRAMHDVIRPKEGWRVRFNFRGWYAADWDDLLLAQGDVGLLLHLSRSD